MRARRGALALTTLALVMGTIATPTAAAGASRWVDDDGKAGPSGCNGAATAFKKVQKAIDAASAGDTVRVCPGTYREALRIGAAKDGLTLIAEHQWEARIDQPATEVGDDSALLIIRPGADDVTVQGLVFVAHPPTFQTAGSGCQLDVAIWVRARRAVIRANRIRATGFTYQECGYYDGIRVGTLRLADEMTAGVDPPASALVTHNSLRDFIFDGITVAGSGVTGTVQRNSIRYWHLGSTPSASVAARLRRAVSRPWTRVGPAGPGGIGYGIAMGLGAQGDIYGNEVSSGPDAAPLSAGLTPILTFGIVTGESSDITVRQNTVRRAIYAFPVFFASDIVLKNNVAIEHGAGIVLMGASDNVVRGNQVGPGGDGIAIYSGQMAGPIEPSEDNRVIGNTSLGHVGWDCLDQTIGGYLQGTANLWTGNTGYSSDPGGLCITD